MADLFSKRRRKLAPVEKIPAPKESELHVNVAAVLGNYAKRDWRWTHFPAGEKRDVVTGAKLKRMGLKRGWADFIGVNPDGLFHSLEIKRGGESLTEEQADFKAWADDHGIPYAVCVDLPGVLFVLNKWGALRLTFNAYGVPALGEGQ